MKKVILVVDEGFIKSITSLSDRSDKCIAHVLSRLEEDGLCAEDIMETLEFYADECEE